MFEMVVGRDEKALAKALVRRSHESSRKKHFMMKTSNVAAIFVSSWLSSKHPRFLH
jgi:hypothetical protein